VHRACGRNRWLAVINIVPKSRSTGERYDIVGYDGKYRCLARNWLAL
jgi:hypothetical protein